MNKLDYYEREFIRKGAAELRDVEFKSRMDYLKLHNLDEEWATEMLSDKPIIGIVVLDPTTKIVQFKNESDG